MKIINLTQHSATKVQLDAGVFDVLTDSQKSSLLNFDEIPTHDEIYKRALILSNIARNAGVKSAMIGGAPYLMSTLEKILKISGIKPLYAFSKRDVVETPNADGTVSKKVVFRHLGFFEA